MSGTEKNNSISLSLVCTDRYEMVPTRLLNLHFPSLHLLSGNSDLTSEHKAYKVLYLELLIFFLQFTMKKLNSYGQEGRIPAFPYATHCKFEEKSQNLWI